jgi:hypothetical protein
MYLKPAAEKNVKMKWTDGIQYDDVYQRTKEEILLLKIIKNRRHS